MYKFSVVIITLNEENNIGKCVRSANKVSDDVIVIDSGSTDNTINVAKENGAKVYNVDWMGYSRTKNYGVEKAANEWILSMDADEFLSDKLIRSLKNTILENGTIYLINRLSSFLGKWVRHSGWHPEWKKRLYNKNEFHWNDAKVHEELTGYIKPNTIKLDGILYHYSYISEKDVKDKTEKYARLLALEMQRKGKPPKTLKRLFGAKYKFINTFIFKLGFLDGITGYRVSIMNSRVVDLKLKYYKFIKNKKNIQ